MKKQNKKQHEQPKIVSKKTELQKIYKKQKKRRKTKARNKSMNVFDSVTN